MPQVCSWRRSEKKVTADMMYPLDPGLSGLVENLGLCLVIPPIKIGRLWKLWHYGHGISTVRITA